MFIFRPQSDWSLLNEKAAAELGIKDEKRSVRVYAGAAHAALELALGYFQQFPLKKKFYYPKNFDPHLQLAVTALSKQGLQAVVLSAENLQKPDEIVAGLDRESGIFLLPFENPLTGADYQIQSLDQKLAEKSAFRISFHYSPSKFLSYADTADRTALRVLQLPSQVGNGASLAVLGERCRFPVLASEAFEVCKPSELSGLSTFLTDSASSPSDLSGFATALECLQIPGLKKIPSSSDRLVLTLQDCDGHALIHFLALQLGRPLEVVPGTDSRFETASLTRWGGLKTMDWLEDHGLTKEQVRGSVFLFDDYFKMQNPNSLAQAFLSAYKQVQALQAGGRDLGGSS
jgi:hypothetical protein